MEKSLATIEAELHADNEKVKTSADNQPAAGLVGLKNLRLDILSPGDLATLQMERSVLQARLISTENLRQRFEETGKFWRQYIDDPGSLRTGLFESFYRDAGEFRRMFDMSEFDSEAVKRLGEISKIVLSQIVHLVDGGTPAWNNPLMALAAWCPVSGRIRSLTVGFKDFL